MSTLRQEGDLLVTGTARFGNVSLPANSVGDFAVDAANPITVEKLEHQYSVMYSQKKGTSVAAERKVVHYAYGAGEIANCIAGVTAAAVGDSTCTVNIKKNGSNILSAAIVIDNTNVVNAAESGAFTSNTYVAGDVIEVDATISAGSGTLPQGLFVNLVLREAVQ